MNNIHPSIYGWMYVCMDGWMDACMHACMYASMYVCMYVYMYVLRTFHISFTNKEIEFLKSVWRLMKQVGPQTDRILIKNPHGI